MMIALAPLMAQAVAASGFAPPLDRPIAYTISEVREDGARTQRFAVDRRVTFRRTANGFTATVETLAVTGDAGRAGQLLVAMARATLDQRIVVRLDSAGRVIDVDDIDAVWAAQVASVTRALTGPDPARAATVAALTAPLQAMPRAGQVKRIGDMVAAVIASSPLAPSPARVVSLPARGRDGGEVLLAGTEQAAVAPDGLLQFERKASGVVGGSPMTVVQRRRIDSRTGLIRDAVAISTVDTAGVRQIVTRSTVMKP
ncbi:MAG: hypothetical protein V4537_13720 [Pseudomonadota bacterium]